VSSPEEDSYDETKEKLEKPVKGPRMNEIRKSVLNEEPRQIEYTQEELRVLSL
jgi:hypothetical protein